MLRRGLLLIMVLVFATMGCSTLPSEGKSKRPPILRGSNEQIQERLLARIPVGTTREEAERVIQSLGLELTPQPDYGFEPRGDVIECQYSGRKGLIFEATWFIEVRCPNGKVSDIICEHMVFAY
jgi:hypothetical protein